MPGFGGSAAALPRLTCLQGEPRGPLLPRERPLGTVRPPAQLHHSAAKRDPELLLHRPIGALRAGPMGNAQLRVSAPSQGQSEGGGGRRMWMGLGQSEGGKGRGRGSARKEGLSEANQRRRRSRSCSTPPPSGLRGRRSPAGEF